MSLLQITIVYCLIFISDKCHISLFMAYRIYKFILNNHFLKYIQILQRVFEKHSCKMCFTICKQHFLTRLDRAGFFNFLSTSYQFSFSGAGDSYQSLPLPEKVVEFLHPYSRLRYHIAEIFLFLLHFP